MNQRELISNYVDSRPLKFNPELFERNDLNIIEELKSTILSCERCNEYFEIKVLNFRVVEDYNEINHILRDYYNGTNYNKSKSKKKDNPYEYINLNQSAIRLLIVTYYIRAKDGEDTIDVIIAVPRIVDKYYFLINGIMRSTLYQIVDGSTYNNGTSNAKNPSVTMKIIFMSVRVYRWYCDLITTNGTALRTCYYNSRIFNKSVPGLKYILAKYGYTGTLNFMGIRGVYLSQKESFNPHVYCFKVSDNIYINAIRELFDSNFIIQSFVATLYNAIIPGMNYNDIFDPLFWVRSLGADFNNIDKEKLLMIINHEESSTIVDTLQKGYSILTSFETIYDRSTKKNIKLPEEAKGDMYCVLRWMLREFNGLRLKSNLDISIKRIRFEEYVASLYAMKIARGIYRVADFNKKATLHSIIQAIRTNPNYLLTAISKCKMVSYRNMTSDMDSMLGLKFTFKGVSGLGESNNKSIPRIYRSLQVSHIGHIDLDSSSDGNPGMTGTICPFVQLYDGYFTNYQEPNGWEEDFNKTFEDYRQVNGLIEVMTFEEKVLGINHTPELRVAQEISDTMKQLINPNANTGEIYPIIWEPVTWEDGYGC